MEIYQEIFDKAKAMAQGRFPETAEAVLQDMCKAAYDEFSGRLQKDVDIADIEEKFIRAAAMLGVALCMGLDPELEESFSAGSVSVKRLSASSRRDAAASMREQAELMLSGYLDDGGFAFRTVRV